MKSIVIGTAGHIDHGKSALVLALTGTDPDRLKEEKSRGITIDLGFAHAEIGGHDIAFVDVPGHERFVKNMLAGVGGIDAVLLVIAADEAVMPQTREHLRDLPAAPDPGRHRRPHEGRPRRCRRRSSWRGLEARELVAGIAARGGAGRAGVVEDRARGSTACARRSERSPGGCRTDLRTVRRRLPIDRVFSVRGFGTVVTGTLTRVAIGVDDELILLPSETRVKVRGLQVYGAPRSRSAPAGAWPSTSAAWTSTTCSAATR